MKKESRQNLINIFMVVSSNILTIVVSLIMGFLFPKHLTVSQYSYYRIYGLYITCAGFFHFGLVNGIYLKYGHLDKDQLPIERFRNYSRVMFLLQAVVTCLLGGLVLLAGMDDQNVTIAYLFTIINVPLMNLKWFYSSINQFTKRFFQDSMVTYLQNILQFVLTISVVVFKLYDYRILLAALTLVNLVCMLMVMVQNTDLIFGHSAQTDFKDLTGLIRQGFFFMLSEFAAILVLGIDSMFVERLFTRTDFAMYSFAVSIISVIYSLISAVSNLIYPYLVRVDDEKYPEYYNLMSNFVAIISVMSLLAYFVAKLIVDLWLPQYTDSIEISAILFGTIVFRTLMMLVCNNFFKVLKLTREYSFNNIFAIVLSFITDLLAYLIFKDTIWIALASLFSFIIWYLVTDYTFMKRLKFPFFFNLRRYFCITVSLGFFYLIRNMSDIWAFCLYLVVIGLFCLVCFRKQILQILGMVLPKKKAV